MKRFTTHNQQKGKVGEDFAAMLLNKLNYTILERNYTKKVGEIDIIAMKGNQLYFFEVKKSLNCNYNPLENVTHKKLQAIRKTSLLYLSSKDLLKTANYSIGVISIKQNRGLIHVDLIENV